MMKKLALVQGLCIAAAALVGGCSHGYKTTITQITAPYQLGQFEASEQQASAAAAAAAPRDKLAMLLEQGSALRAVGRFKESNAAFDQADLLCDGYDQKAKLRVGREAYAIATSPAALDYEGYGYDRIMVNVYKALNYMEMGEKERIRTEIKRMGFAQQKIANDKESQLAKIRERREQKLTQSEQARKETKDVDSDMATLRKDPKFSASEKAIFADFADMPLEDKSAEGLYLNPFAGYLQGLYYLNAGDANERELARVCLHSTLEMAPHNSYLREDAEIAEQGDGRKPQATPRTYVIFETGMAAMRTEIRIDLPIFAVRAIGAKPNVDYIGVAFPKLTRLADRHEYLSVVVGGKSFKTETLADMDQIVRREFMDELPVIITRLVLSTGAKVAAQYAAEKATEKQSQFVQLLTHGIVDAYSALMNEADVRSWRTLPKQVQIASFPTPADGKLSLSTPGGAAGGSAIVRPGKANIVWVRSPGRAAPILVHSFALN